VGRLFLQHPWPEPPGEEKEESLSGVPASEEEAPAGEEEPHPVSPADAADGAAEPLPVLLVDDGDAGAEPLPVSPADAADGAGKRGEPPAEGEVETGAPGGTAAEI